MNCPSLIGSLTYLLIELHVITVFLLTRNLGKKHRLFHNSLLIDNYSVIIKILLTVGTILFLSLVLHYIKKHYTSDFEILILLGFTLLALFILISANDLLTLYLGIEMQSLCLYTLAALKRSSRFSSEAGLKYFILGALSSSILIFGISFIYGITGSTNFDDIAKTLSSLWENHNDLPATLLVGGTCLLCSLLFKIAAVPFHM